ncbi:exported protease [Amycolatopsis mediterranei S699]|uniref:Exported protease n=2 Tax=Amycolatopsis mediterranei TaxID=33910 RepID=A0A0H3CWK7_AMYMU|nr:alpha/beta hydrolase [Amycolatopsis mediterranei]ADJ43032.1 exported protease [Amycolatopsis mediterranei U32]AEK39727.1 exported protease [Amycolatopsis mediterranei S699]AFO74746.1 exported protease [Amycolatopsis mediterranei S699]AGT81875.1 exported protease [Amycolatopsis mediterranei RB]KDO04301.1 hydrolase [Amycolatopsis mediterranei]
MLFAASLTACTSTGKTEPPAPTTESHPPSGPVPAGLERFYGQSLSWADCAPYATSEDSRSAFQAKDVQCARLTVPLDYAKPTGDTITLGLLRRKATGERIGSLVVNPGGPGASGMVAAAGLAKPMTSTGLGKRFDLVGFDPRGIGASQPAIHCLTDQERDADRADDSETDGSPAGVLKQESQEKDFAAKCAQRTDDGTGMLANVGTRDVVKDLDVLRSVLGDEKLTYLGYSYGTRIGSAYAEAFPKNVRAMILDGAVDPEQDAVESLVAQGQGFGTAFTQFAKSCTAQQDCALGADAGGAVKAFQDLVRPLIDFPVPVGDGRKLSYEDATTGVIQALYQESLWDTLNTGLNELKQQRGATLEKLADIYNERDTDGKYGTTQDAFTAIRCVDDPRVTDPAVILKAQEEYVKVAPFLDDGRPASAARDACAFWPVPNTSEPHVPNVEGLAKTLVISTTNDPATPYQAGVNLAKGLKGALLTFEGTQHTVFLQGVKCVDQAGTDYLVDGTVPPDGKRCSGQ